MFRSKEIRRRLVRSALYPALAWPRDELLILQNILRHRLDDRRVQAFCVGTAKSGTHSIASMFSRSVRAAHEPHTIMLINALKGASRYSIDPSRCSRMLRRRDRILALEIESSNLLGPFVETLVEIFPTSRFVLPIRDCFSWLDSILNQQLRKRDSVRDLKWGRVWDFYFQREHNEHSRDEQVLRRLGLHTLDGYFGYWHTHNQCVLEAVPAERLFVLRTAEIGRRAGELAAFLGIPASSADVSQSRTYVARSKFNVLDDLDPDYLTARGRAHCGELMDRFYPEIRTFRQSLVSRENPNSAGNPLASSI